MGPSLQSLQVDVASFLQKNLLKPLSLIQAIIQSSYWDENNVDLVNMIKNVYISLFFLIWTYINIKLRILFMFLSSIRSDYDTENPECLEY